MASALSVIALALAALGCAESTLDAADAEDFFGRYAKAVSNFDPELAALYADDAEIMIVTRTLGGGYQRQELTGADYKVMIPNILALARRDGVLVSFKDVAYAQEDGRVRITGTRRANVERGGAPFSLTVGPDDSGAWKIFSERLVILPTS